jgi:hypothetical protein
VAITVAATLLLTLFACILVAARSV